MEHNYKTRTLGDGMASPTTQLETITQFNLKLNTSYNMLTCMKPVIPKGKIIRTIPKYIPAERKKPKYLTAKQKEPRFVPYEPFKAAVTPIIAKKKPTRGVVTAPSRNNVDLNDLVLQMNDIRVHELSLVKEKVPEILITKEQYDKLKNSYEVDVKNLRESNSHLENQLKMQAQVNSELKTLLVAAVGEDLESRVQHLTEDKLQLARALLNSADNLTSNQEQTEWLSGLCEVWRSKFLASSLMVEELARWKSALTNRINDMQDNLKSLLDDRSKLRQYSLATYNNLRKLKENNGDGLPKRFNTLDLAKANVFLSESLVERNTTNGINEVIKINQILNTAAEGIAYKIIRNPVYLPTKPDAVCTAVVGAAAMTLPVGQMYPQNTSLHSSCCGHCTGEIHDI